ncbi:hypothetical protein PAECIP111894_00061 [Paenibacillus pseudetheri]|uniref:Uncharacterized protein n=1 Tax=Paenibacillus pseudetheri TaxID=2897682 RepID=A0ABM9B611_9BACL|nr:hypothetical protein PAECIP111894_00061 [Paenibacillus pseudetheri]
MFPLSDTVQNNPFISLSKLLTLNYGVIINLSSLTVKSVEGAKFCKPR